MTNTYCKEGIASELCELWRNGLECPDCQNCINYRVLPDITIGSKVSYKVFKTFINHYGGKFSKNLDQQGIVTSLYTEAKAYSVKSIDYPFTSRIIKRIEITKVG